MKCNFLRRFIISAVGIRNKCRSGSFFLLKNVTPGFVRFVQKNVRNAYIYGSKYLYLRANPSLQRSFWRVFAKHAKRFAQVGISCHRDKTNGIGRVREPGQREGARCLGGALRPLLQGALCLFGVAHGRCRVRRGSRSGVAAQDVAVGSDLFGASRTCGLSLPFGLPQFAGLPARPQQPRVVAAEHA